MNLIVSLLMGTLLGFLTGLGIGGGSLLILWLTLALKMPQAEARGINLLFFLPAALTSCVFRHRQGHLNIRQILPSMAAGAAGAALFSFIGTAIDVALLRKPFGILLLVTGLRELTYRPRNAK